MPLAKGYENYYSTIRMDLNAKNVTLLRPTDYIIRRNCKYIRYFRVLPQY